MTANDWKDTRTHARHFSEKERIFIRKCWRLRLPTKDVADELGCSIRAVQRCYRQLREGVV